MRIEENLEKILASLKVKRLKFFEKEKYLADLKCLIDLIHTFESELTTLQLISFDYDTKNSTLLSDLQRSILHKQRSILHKLRLLPNLQRSIYSNLALIEDNIADEFLTYIPPVVEQNFAADALEFFSSIIQQKKENHLPLIEKVAPNNETASSSSSTVNSIASCSTKRVFLVERRSKKRQYDEAQDNPNKRQRPLERKGEKRQYKENQDNISKRQRSHP